MSKPATETRSVIVERDFPHSPEKLWRALTQPHLVEEWLMKNDFKPVEGRRFNLRGDWGGVLDCQVLKSSRTERCPTRGILRTTMQPTICRAS